MNAPRPNESPPNKLNRSPRRNANAAGNVVLWPQQLRQLGNIRCLCAGPHRASVAALTFAAPTRPRNKRACPLASRIENDSPPGCSSTDQGGGKRRTGIYQALKRRAVSWSLSIRFARTLPLPHFLQRSRFTKLAMGASGRMPKSVNSLLLKRFLWRQWRHRTGTTNSTAFTTNPLRPHASPLAPSGS